MRAGKQTPLYLLPTINQREAAAFWNMGYRKWNTLYGKELHKQIRRFKNLNEWRYVLSDILKAAFPEASNEALYMMAYRFLQDSRRARNEANAEQVLKIQKSGGD